MHDIGLRVSVTIAGLVAAAVHIFFPAWVPDAITAGFVAVAILPWLAPLIKSIEVPGFGKVELSEIRREVQEARGAATSANQKAEFALVELPKPMEVRTEKARATASQDILSLIEEYNRIRESQRSGPSRTSAMTAVIRKMINIAPQLSGFNVREELKQTDRGRRLAAYAYLYALPDPQLLPILVESVSKVEDKPFGQYWGIQAINRVIDITSPVDNRIIDQLSNFLRQLKPGTDRYYELNKTLESLID